MNDYKEEFEKAVATITVLEKRIDGLNAEKESYRKALTERESEVMMYLNENIKLKNAIISKFLGIDLTGDEDV